MLIQWVPAGALIAATLGDDTNKYFVVIEQLGAQSIAQVEALAGAGFRAQFPRGNVAGELVFTSSKSYASYSQTFSQFLTEYSRLNQQGLLVLTEGLVVLDFANAILKSVQRIFDAQHTGTHMGIRYTFSITSIQ